LASQRITVAKIGGLAADVSLRRLQAWSAARQTRDPNEWSSEQWPQHVRAETDAFANRLRANAFTPPVIYFVEWADLWSMGDVFQRWLAPLEGPMPLAVLADQYEVFAYGLPDGGRLAQRLATAGTQQWPETDWLLGRLRDAIGDSEALVERAVLIVLRYVVGPSASGQDVRDSLRRVPDWLS
jgi:hypothetical protein